IMSEKKSRDADEIFSQFEKHKEESVKPEEKVQEPAPEPQPEPSIVQAEPVTPSEEPDEPQPSQEPEIVAEEEAVVKTRNVIFVGIKPIMTYVTATLTQLASSPTVTIKARGKRITQAVDVSQMIVKRMDSVGYKVTGVRISSDSLLSQDGKTRNVSTIEVDVTKVDS
ncbi:MAG: DNA-binding protein, partial [Nitrosopumilaceae archaeon]|nr:DNA-binding protein [Nitrosopumilaceae archaeon]